MLEAVGVVAPAERGGEFFDARLGNAVLGVLRAGGVFGEGDALDDAQDRPGDLDLLEGARHLPLAIGDRGVGRTAHVEAQQLAGRGRSQREQHDAVGVAARAGRG